MSWRLAVERVSVPRLSALLCVAMPLLLATAVAVLPGRAAAAVEIGSNGSAAGQTLNPAGVAVDYTEELLYVADADNERVAVFDAANGEFVRAFGWGVADGVSEELQVCTTTCFAGIAGSSSGQFDRMTGIAVDNDAGSPGFHDVYVFDGDNHRVQRLTPAGEFVWTIGDEVNETTGEDLCTQSSGDTCKAGVKGDADGQFNVPASGSGVAIGPGGVVHVHDSKGSGAAAETRVQFYEPSGAYVKTVSIPVAGGSGRSTATAVDAAGRLYLGTAGAQGALRVYEPDGTELFAVDPSFNVNGVAIDPETGNFWVGDNTGASGVLEFDSGGTQLRTFYDSLFRRVSGLARFSGVSGELFATEEGGTSPGLLSRLLSLSFPPPGPIVYEGKGGIAASEVGSVRATLNARINPENEATSYQFEYISDADYVAAGETFGAGTMTTPEEEMGGEVDFKLHPLADASTEITELFPETVYRFRAVASNASGGPIVGPTASFKTKEPIEFGDAWSVEVGTDRATLSAEANPRGLAASARFQYVDETSFEESEFAAANEAPAPAAEPLDLGSSEEFVTRSAQLFGLTPGTTYHYRILAENQCEPEPAPLCQFAGPERTFRTFAPPQGKVTGCPNDEFRLGAAGFLPDCRAYEMVSPVDKNGANVEVVDNISGFPAGLDQAAVDGSSITYSTYKAFGEIASAPYTNQYLARRGSEGWSSEGISPPREGPSIMTYLSAHLDRQYKFFGGDLCDGWVVQDANPILAEGGIAEYPGLYRRDDCGPSLGSYETITRLEPPLLDPGLEPRQFIPELQGTSSDGEVAVFRVWANLTADAPPQEPGCEKSASCEQRLYEATEEDLSLVCILPDESPLEGSCSAGNGVGAGGERSGTTARAVSADGSRIFWIDSGAGLGNLYVRVDGAETIQITTEPTQFWTAAVDGSKVVYAVKEKLFEYDVDAETETLIAEEIGEDAGVAGASEDASRIYLTSVQELAAGSTAGKPNLYLYEVGTGFKFVATLPSADGVGGTKPVTTTPNRRSSRVTPDGEQIAFMWGGSLTGYDNTDAVSGEPDQEVFLYDSTADGGAGELRCVSCNPTGARPAGRVIGRKLIENVWAAAWIPAWESQLYGQRLLSDDGQRLYFNSFEALVPRDVNGREDVYQWEAVGAGSCTNADPSFSESAAGCVTLISSGQSSRGSEIVEIGADGDDVFFKTESSLVSQDRGLVDIYDARVSGGFPEPEPEPAECEGEACQNPAPAPEVQTPSSLNVGPGNPPYVKKHKPRRCPKGKHKVKRKGKVRCVKKKVQRKRHRHYRVSSAGSAR